MVSLIKQRELELKIKVLELEVEKLKLQLDRFETYPFYPNRVGDTSPYSPLFPYQTWC